MIVTDYTYKIETTWFEIRQHFSHFYPNRHYPRYPSGPIRGSIEGNFGPIAKPASVGATAGCAGGSEPVWQAAARIHQMRQLYRRCRCTMRPFCIRHSAGPTDFQKQSETCRRHHRSEDVRASNIGRLEHCH